MSKFYRSNGITVHVEQPAHAKSINIAIDIWQINSTCVLSVSAFFLGKGIGRYVTLHLASR